MLKPEDPPPPRYPRIENSSRVPLPHGMTARQLIAHLMSVPGDAVIRPHHSPRDRPFESDTYSLELVWIPALPPDGLVYLPPNDPKPNQEGEME